jgi:Tol biopolymer transport system component
MGKRILILVVLVLGLVLVNPDAAGAHSTGSGSGLIVAERYSAENNGNPQLVAVRPSDGTVKVLTSGHSDMIPDLSPSGRFVVFERCVNAQDCSEAGKINIWIMRVDGSAAHPLTFCDGSRCLGAFDPAFSPDGRQVAFAQDLLDANGVNFNNIFVMRSDGTGERQVTSQRSSDAPAVGHPRFSPDGKKLVFGQEVEGGGRLMIINTDGSGLHGLLPDADAFDPDWSPDGKHIAMTLVMHSGGLDFGNIATVRPDGTHLRLLTHETAGVSNAFQPDYSPDGRHIVFTEGDATGCHLIITDANGHHRRQLQTVDGCYGNSSWAKDRRRIGS